MGRPGLVRLFLILTLCIPILAVVHTIAAQSSTPTIMTGQTIQLLAGQSTQRSEVNPPSQLADTTQSATFNVTYTGFPAAAQKAFQAAVNIWQTQISSPVVIRIDAQWMSLDKGVLGEAGSSTYIRNFSGAPVANTFYPIALANKLAGKDLDPNGVDIVARFNSSFSTWYFGTDGKVPSGKYDLESVVLHEIGHGLGFDSSMNGPDSEASWGIGSGYPLIYDLFAVNNSNQQLIDTKLFPNPSSTLKAQLTSNKVFFNGSYATAANNGPKPKLYAPSSWEAGSSFSHLDEKTYPAGNANSLMTPILDDGESVHNPGPVALGILADIGWNMPSIQATATATTPTTTPSGMKQLYLGIVMRDAVIENPTEMPAASATNAVTETETVMPTGTAVPTAVPSVTP